MKTKKAPSRLAAVKQNAAEIISEAQTEVAKEANKELLTIAVGMPHGQAKRFLDIVQNLRAIKAEKKAIAKKERGERAGLKEMKVDLKAFDHTMKLSEMEPEDVRSFEATVGLYKETMAMPLSEHQKVIKEEMARQREAARDAMIDASGGDTGKEIGSSTQYGAANDPEVVNGGRPFVGKVPEKNEDFNAPKAAAH